MKTQSKIKIGKVILPLIFGVLLIWIVSTATCNNDKEKATDKKMNTEQMITRSWIMAQSMVQNRLKSPSTADFPSMPDGYKLEGDSTIILQGYVDSQNSFGAMMRTKFLIKVQYLGGQWSEKKNWQEIDFQLLK